MTLIVQRAITFVFAIMLAAASVDAQTGFRLDAPPSVPPQEGSPLLCKDLVSGLLFYVESDGRRLSAIDKDGKLLWCKDLFADPAIISEHLKRPTRLLMWEGSPYLMGSLRRATLLPH